MKKLFTLFLTSMFMSVISFAQTTTLLPYGSNWKYLADGTDQGTGWQAAAYDDSQWKSGPAVLGFSTNNKTPITTLISYGPDANNKYITSYFRTNLNLSDASMVDTLILNAKFDDGLVVYINGSEVYRNTMPTGTITYSTLAGSGDDGKTEHRTKLTNVASKLVSGNNVIAVEVHQSAVTSSDLVLDMQLQAKVASTPFTLFPYGSIWKFSDTGTDLSASAWTSSSYDDSQWGKGPAVLGFSTNNKTPITTYVSYGPDANNKYITTYFRSAVNITDASFIDTLLFNCKVDDGMILYVNGVDVYRYNMPATGPVAYSLLTPGSGDDGKFAHTAKLTNLQSKIVSGMNTFAVEVHQSAATSSDLVLDMQLQGKIKAATTTTIPVNHVKTALIRGPYLQKATSSSIVLRWRTNNKVNSKVVYGLSPLSLTQSVTLASDTTEHYVTLTGLTPYTKYYYAVSFKDTLLQGDAQNYFLTSPVQGTEGKYSFWVVGDCGNNSTNQKNVRDQFYAYRGSNVTNGWLLLGDNAYSNGTDDQFRDEFFGIYDGGASKNIPLWPVPGNHDYDNALVNQNSHAVPYYSIFETPTNAEAGGVASGTEAFYSYDYGNIHFLALDSYGQEDQATRLYDTTGAQVKWIKKDLAANKGKWTIAYWHHPPYTMGSHNSDLEDELVQVRTNFIRILERNGVDLILCGHSHDYERSKLMKGHYGLESTFNPAVHNLSQSTGRYDGTVNSCTYLKDSLHTLDGTVYVVSGSAGQLGGQDPSFPHEALRAYSDATNGGSLVLEIEGSRLDAKWVNADGQTRDNFTIIKDASKVKTFTVALGDSVDLTASWKGNYKWSNANSLTTKTVNVKPSQDMKIVATDVYECLADTFKIHVNIPTILPISNTAKYCLGDNITIPFTIAGKFFGNNIFTLQLSDEKGSFANPRVLGTLTSTASGSFTAALPANLAVGTGYQVRIVSTSPVVTSQLLTQPFAINSIVKPIVSADNNSMLTSSAATGNIWYLNGQVISGATSNTLAATVSGKYKVKVTDANSCIAESDEVNVNVTVTGIEVIAPNQNVFDVKAFPNPFHSEIKVSYQLAHADETTIELFNLEGMVVSRPVQKQLLGAGQHEITINAKTLGLVSGVYIVKVGTNDYTSLIKLNYISE